MGNAEWTLISHVGFQNCSRLVDVTLQLILLIIELGAETIGVGMVHREEQAPVTIEELLVTTLATSDALAKLLIEKGIITKEEFLRRILEERMTYQALLKPEVH